ncbi:MAG: tetratricopeptide repeat protein [Alphaproteobacteria bacterium]|nr:tetratricopeptide repeat protein [Alphaproteobacteria bacterium]
MTEIDLDTTNRLADLIRTGNSAKAIPDIEKQISLSPRDDRLWALLGQAHFHVNRFAEAVTALREALRLKPDHAAHCGDLGIALRADGRVTEAEALLREAIRRDGANPLSRFALGNLFVSQRRHEEAIAVFGSILAQNPGFFPAIENLASLFSDLGRLQDALKLIETALQRAPQDHRLYSMLAIILDKGGNQNAALDVTLKAIALDPPKTLDMRLASFMSLTGRTGRLDLRDKVMELLRPAINETLSDDQPESWRKFDRNALRRFIFLFPYYGIPDRALMKVHSTVGNAIAASFPAENLPPRSKKEKIRIGYLSHNFGNHPIGHLLSCFFEAHGHQDHEVFLYATHIFAQDASGYGERLKQAADHFIDCRGWTDQFFANRIRADEIDILIDLDGYMHGGRPEMLATRVAPVQIHWLQSLAGCPAPYIDYTIVDRILVPDEERDQGNGPLIRLADAFQCGELFDLPPSSPSRASHDLPDDAFVFCAFGNWLKIDEHVFNDWMTILKAVPKSVLWLTSGPLPTSLSTLQRYAEAQGVEGSRLIVAPRTDDKISHIDRHRCADLYIDTYTFSAATSATDALSAGLPVLTKRGSTAQSRLAESLIRATGVPQLIVEDRQAYIETAITLAKNPDQLKNHQKALRDALPNAPLFDAHRMVRQFEMIYDHIITRYRAGLKPEHFDVVL